mmetsp:Transcript_7518/g.22842  ORF Transcript_7518/g.22842 Transcript_7518/m.22842 type:complete len:200 (+) Transcript_7518:21-620(+)
MSEENGNKIVSELRGEIQQFYQLSKGSIEAVGLLFSELAKQPLPPNIICDLLGMDKAAVKAAFESGKPPTATEEQFINAIKQSVDAEDTVDSYRPVLQSHIKRFENAEQVMSALSGQLTEFHTKVGGDVSKIAGLFSDLTPETQKGQPLPPGLINALLRIDPKATTCSVECFLSCFRRNLDTADTADVIRPVIAKHIAA